MKGIMFTEDLFPKVVDGSKTQTRRTGGLEIVNKFPEKYHLIGKGIAGYTAFNYLLSDIKKNCKPRYKVGETVYLKEPYFLHDTLVLHKYGLIEPEVNFARSLISRNDNWKNKRTMPAAYARYSIEFTGIRVERLYDISEVDAKAEGVKECKNELYLDYVDKLIMYIWPSDSFFSLFRKINGQKLFDLNPWVWVYEFKLVEKP